MAHTSPAQVKNRCPTRPRSLWTVGRHAAWGDRFSSNTALPLEYAGRIREGCRPHPRHWQALAQLVGLQAERVRLTSLVKLSRFSDFVTISIFLVDYGHNRTKIVAHS